VFAAGLSPPPCATWRSLRYALRHFHGSASHLALHNPSLEPTAFGVGSAQTLGRMNVNPAAAPIQHLQRLQALLGDLEPLNIALQRHEYDSLAFGDFVVVLVTGHKAARFIWDGRESILTVEYQARQNQSIAGTWVHDAFISVSPREAVFAEIGSNAVSLLT